LKKLRGTKLRILHISNPANIPVEGYGGTERVVYSLAKKQAEYGHDVTVIAGKPSIIPHVRDASFVKGTPYTEKKFMMNRVLTGYSLRAMLKSRNGEFDIIHNHIAEEAICFSILSKSFVITTLHCPITLRKFWPFVATSMSRLLPRKTKFVTVSRRSFKAYQPFYGSDLIAFIHNGIDLSNIPFNSKPKREHEIQLCFVGKLIQEKHPHKAIKVADIIHKWGYDVKLYIIGKLDFPISKYNQRLISMVKSRKYAVLLPNVETEMVYDILGNCDVFITASFEIGLMTAQLESLATGTPIIGLVDGAAEEVVFEGYNGYLGVNLYDMARKCLTALDIDRMNCRKFVEHNFSEQSMYEKYMDVYHHILISNSDKVKTS